MKQKLCKWLLDNGAVFTENLYYKYSGTKSALYRFCEENGIGIKAGKYDGFYKCYVDDKRMESGKRVLCVVKIVKPYRKPVDDEYKLVVTFYGWKAGTSEIDENGNTTIVYNGISTYKALREKIQFLKQQSKMSKRGKIKTLKVFANNTVVCRKLWIE